MWSGIVVAAVDLVRERYDVAAEMNSRYDLEGELRIGGQIAAVDRRSRTIVVRLGRSSSEAGGPYGLANAARVVTWALR